MKLKTKIIAGLLVALTATLIPVMSESGGIKIKTIVLTKDNTIILNGEVNGESVSGVISKAKELGSDASIFKNKDPLYLYMRTPGGEIQLGLEMIEVLKGLNRPVDTITTFAASMGFQSVQMLGKRYITKNGILMSHRASGGFNGEFGGQKPSQIDSRKNFWEQRIEEMDKLTVERTKGKQTLESYRKAYVSELWLTGQQAIDQGYADELVVVRCDKTLSGTTTHHIKVFEIDLAYELDACPLNSTPLNVKAFVHTNKGLFTADEFLSKNGEFGTSCFMASGTNHEKLCAADTSLTLEKINQVKEQFKHNYADIKNHVIPMRF